MLSKLKKMFGKSGDKIEAFNEASSHRKYGIQISQHIDNGKHMVYVNDIFQDDTVIAIFENEQQVSEFIDELTAEISHTAKQRKADIEERLVQDLNKLTYLHKSKCKEMFISQYKKTMFSIYLNKKVVKHVNDYIEDKIFGENNELPS